MRERYLVIILAIITVFILGCIGDSDPGTSLEIRKVDIQSYDYVSNITIEELSRYPVLEKAINGEGCIQYSGYSQCKISPDDWNKIKNFIQSKEVDDRAGRGGTCFKTGEKYGETCYTIGFVTP